MMDETTKMITELFNVTEAEAALMMAPRTSRESQGWELDRSHQAARMSWGPGPLPHRSHFEGTIRRPDGRTGALIQINHTGVYIQGNAGVCTTLDQSAVKDLLGR